MRETAIVRALVATLVVASLAVAGLAAADGMAVGHAGTQAPEGTPNETGDESTSNDGVGGLSGLLDGERERPRPPGERNPAPADGDARTDTADASGPGSEADRPAGRAGAAGGLPGHDPRGPRL
ncbi:hypothetical protein BRD17_04855 [Halobacteriales archaeon SW_7_68_16]|nr:MAG: hypothetical protein BRD17_04855 [Halobacteriales archaeon SW_7_68_16]